MSFFWHKQVRIPAGMTSCQPRMASETLGCACGSKVSEMFTSFLTVFYFLTLEIRNFACEKVDVFSLMKRFMRCSPVAERQMKVGFHASCCLGGSTWRFRYFFLESTFLTNNIKHRTVWASDYRLSFWCFYLCCGSGNSWRTLWYEYALFVVAG